MPETMRDEFAYAAKVCSEATGGQVKPGIFRVCLNTAALEYARAVRAAALLEQLSTAHPERLRHCSTHGQQPATAWGCPECVRELREQLSAHALPVPGEVTS